MKKIISLFMTLTMMAAILSFTACKKNEIPEDEVSSTQEHSKNTTAKPVEIVDIPESIADRVEMLNSALDYVDVYCYGYTKNTKCDVSGVNVGSLSVASNAVDAFKSVFGHTDVTYDYDYKTAPESFAQNFIDGRFSASDVLSAEANQEGENIILKITFPNENNPTDTNGQLSKISKEYISAAAVNKNLSEFDSSAGSVSVSASDITVTATISASDSSLQKLVVSYIENFALSSVKLVQLEGSSVTGTSKTVVTYSQIK